MEPYKLHFTTTHVRLVETGGGETLFILNREVGDRKVSQNTRMVPILPYYIWEIVARAPYLHVEHQHPTSYLRTLIIIALALDEGRVVCEADGIRKFQDATPEDVTSTLRFGGHESVLTASTAFTKSMPSTSSPNTTCLPSSHSQTGVVMKKSQPMRQ